jgi:molybdate transport system ATP-binding protein
VPLISFEDVSVKLNDQMILRGVWLELRRGDVLRVVGANGAGKSTLLKLLRGDTWPTSGSRTYHFHGEPRESPIGAKERIAFVSPELQERYQRLEFDRTALEVMQTGFAQTDFLYTALESEQLQRSREFAQEMQLGALLERPFRKLSKGQMRQVLLARALIGNPDVLLLDEFFSGLDQVSNQRLRQMVRIRLEQGLTLVYTTHRDEEPLSISVTTIHLEHGQVVRSVHPTVEAQRTAPDPAPDPAPPQHDVETAARATQIEIRDANVYLGEPRDDATAQDGDATKASHLVLEHIDFKLEAGSKWLIVGHNGAGKSTFARLLRGNLSPAAGGSVAWFGSERTPIWERQARIALVSSDSQAWHRVDATGFEIVASGFLGGIGWHRELTLEQTARVRALLEALNVTQLETRNALFFSQGELRKLLIARALVTHPDVIILDEALDYLDAPSRTLVWNLMQREAQKASLIVIAHRQEDAPPFLTRAMRIEHGRIVWIGESDQLPW